MSMSAVGTIRGRVFSGSEDLYDMFDGRHNRGSIVLTPNRAFDERPELLDRPILASAPIERLAHGAARITIPADPCRGKGPPRQTSVAVAGVAGGASLAGESVKERHRK
jgi:hypothetical protein